MHGKTGWKESTKISLSIALRQCDKRTSHPKSVEQVMRQRMQMAACTVVYECVSICRVGPTTGQDGVSHARPVEIFLLESPFRRNWKNIFHSFSSPFCFSRSWRRNLRTGELYCRFNFFSGIEPPPTSGDLGPALATVDAPTPGQPPVLTITSPAAGSTQSGRIQIKGTVVGPINTGVTVDGVRAYVHNGVFISHPVLLTSASSSVTLTAKATTIDGLMTTASRTFELALPPPVALETSTIAGFVPFPVQYVFTNSPGIAVTSVAIDFESDGTIDHTSASIEGIPVKTYTTPGHYIATSTVTLANQSQIVTRREVVALSVGDQRASICAAYGYLRSRLAAQDIPGAGKVFAPSLRDRLIPAFQATGNRLPQVAEKLGTIADGIIGLDTAEITAVKQTNTGLRGFPISFGKDENGVWRINSM